MNRIFFVAVGLLTCCLTVESRSQEPSKEESGRAFYERMLKEFDKDGDGKLNDDERGTALRMTEQFIGRLKERGNPGGNAGGRPEFAEMLKRFDKDGDGKLNEEERAAAQKARQGFGKGGPPRMNLNNPPEFVVKRFDKDGDGKLNDEEKQAAVDAMIKNGGFPGGPLNNPEFMKRFDKDGDGKLSDSEQAAAKEALVKMGGRPGFPSREEMIKRFDKDGDGKLNEEEEKSLRAEMDRRRGTAGGGPGLTPGEGKPQEPKLDKAELIKKFDKDGDGKLNDEESKAAREAFLNRDKP